MAPEEEVRFPLGDDDAPERLRGCLRPGGADAVVVCHPHPAFGGRMTTPLVVALADAAAARGLGALRFNFRGLDGSDGAPSGGLHEHLDVAAAGRFLRTRGARRLALVGYSFGALMATRALLDAGADVVALVAVAFPTSIIDHAADCLADVARALDRRTPALFVHGDDDGFCDPALVAGWAAARPWVEVALLPQQGHFFDGPGQARLLTRVGDFLTSVLGRG